MPVNRAELHEAFARVFPDAAPEFIVRAPGRVNLIGEHTDYNDGFVLPIAMSQALYVVAGSSNDDRLVVHSTAFNESIEFRASDPGAPGPRSWGSYVRGVAAMLCDRGLRLRGGRLLIHSEVPIGGGVSSSAALEVGTGLALLSLAAQQLDGIELALLARQAEHRYAFSPCGIMDQFICVLGRAGHALLLDCRSQAYEHVPLPDAGMVLIVMDTQVKHEIGSSEYPVRQKQCQQGLARLREAYPKASALRDITAAQLNEHAGRLDPLILRRCRHVVTEIARTVSAGDALRAGDTAAFGRLMYDSHASLRDDYQVSCPELDALVEIAATVPGVHGARMTGGGFGGCAIALAEAAAFEPLRSAIAAQYNTRFEKPAIVYTTTASDGAAVDRP